MQAASRVGLSTSVVHYNPACSQSLSSRTFLVYFIFFFSSRRRHTRYWRDWSSDVCSSDLVATPNQWHVPVGLEAVRNDKHVLVTKPLADALPPAEQIVAAAEAAGVVNMIDRKSVV